MQAAPTRYGLLGGLTVAATGAGVRALLTSVGVTGPWHAFAAPLLTGLAMWPLWAPISIAVRRSHAEDIRIAYLDSGRCPSCAFNLSGLPGGEEGLTGCPECGTVWKVKH
jgi:hypothetical protein